MAKRTKRDFSQLTGGEDRQADGFFDQPQEAQRPRAQPARLVSLPPSQILPDRFQPRPILPLELKQQLFSGEADCYQVAQRWLEMAPSQPALEEQLRKLMQMGDTFDQHGQIKPLTGAWVQSGRERYFQLETGERRYWAAVLHTVAAGLEEEPLLEVREITKTSRERQIIENQHAEPPSAVGRAREISALILSHLEMHPDPDLVDEYEYFRQVLDVKRLPQGLWSQIEGVMGIRRPQMVRLLNLLAMPTPLLVQADLYRVPERVLREILSLPPADWPNALDAAIQQKLTNEEIADLADEQPLGAVAKEAEEPARKIQQTAHQKAARRIKSFLRLASRRDVRSAISIVATELAVELQDPQEILYATELLEELAAHLRMRAQENHFEQH